MSTASVLTIHSGLDRSGRHDVRRECVYVVGVLHLQLWLERSGAMTAICAATREVFALAETAIALLAFMLVSATLSSVLVWGLLHGAHVV